MRPDTNGCTGLFYIFTQLHTSTNQLMNRRICLLMPLFFSLLVMLQLPLQAQKKESTPIGDDQDSSYFKTELNYISNSLYNGRKDSLAVPYINASFGYYHKSGLYVSTTLSYLVSSYANRIDLFQIEGGYNGSIGDNFVYSASAHKDFYSQYSVSVKSEIAASFNASLSYNIADAVKINAGADYLLTSGPSDILFNAGLSHEFDFGENGEWAIEPSILANIGTQYYYDRYKQKRHIKTGKKKTLSDSTTVTSNLGTVTTTTTITTLHPNKFLVLNYELSLPITYDSKKWGAFVTPYFAVPQNPATYVTTISTKRVANNGNITRWKSTSSSTEEISNTFYLQLGVYLKF